MPLQLPQRKNASTEETTKTQEKETGTLSQASEVTLRRQQDAEAGNALGRARPNQKSREMLNLKKKPETETIEENTTVNKKGLEMAHTEDIKTTNVHEALEEPEGLTPR
ncbi:hypothetical protein NDU88_003986 [Pleurodeles waltl]|uniref:Uncharacterized protein n=1 Tax=Pleurodeles waltl TaxID=8319 RepID=A0AAV7W537_PLEWA|nr:hypothetical protein NDU88_003986 [Pleurodeles waltl]